MTDTSQVVPNPRISAGSTVDMTGPTCGADPELSEQSPEKNGHSGDAYSQIEVNLTTEVISTLAFTSGRSRHIGGRLVQRVLGGPWL